MKLKNYFAIFILFIVFASLITGLNLLQSPKDVETGKAALQGDCNTDNKVDILDFQLLSNTFGRTSGQTGFNSKCDFNADGRVDILDFQILSNNFGRIGTVTNTTTPRPSVTTGPTPTMPPVGGVPCSSLTGIERRFPCSPLTVGPMPEETGSGTDKWDMFTNILYPGLSDNDGVNERFSAVANPSGSGVVIKNHNLLSDGEGHTTVGTGRSLPIGSTECSAFRWLWKSPEEFPQRGWVLVWQLQMSGSPIVAISTDQTKRTWFYKSRNGADSGFDAHLGDILYGRWAYFVACTHLAEAPNGWTKVWFRHDGWPDVNLAPNYQRSGHDTYQGETGHNTIGIYAGRDGSSTSYYGYFDRYGRALTPQRAIQIAGN